MKTYLIIVLLALSYLSFGQKTYKIENVTWLYSKPETYLYKADNFSEIIKEGEEKLKNNENLNLNAEDQMLFSITKSEDSNFNILIANYLAGNNFKRFTLDGYADKLVDFFKQQFEELKSPAEVTKQKLSIDNKEFYRIKSVVSNSEKKYTAYMFVGIVGNKELDISIVVDNAIDEKILIDSVLNSKFK